MRSTALFIASIALLPVPVLAQQDAPVGGRKDPQQQEEGCKVRRTVEVGVAAGNGFMAKHVAAQLDYGSAAGNLASGDLRSTAAPEPCETSGIGLSLSVSHTDMDVSSRLGGGLDRAQRVDRPSQSGPRGRP